MSHSVEIEDQCNPLDAAEDVLRAQEWAFDRLSEEQLYIGIDGDKGQYKLFFMWDELRNSLQFCCEMELCMTKDRSIEMHKMLADVNSKMWLGHFDLSPDETTGCIAPCFRYNTLIRGMDHISCTALVKDLLRMTLQECERLHDAFNVLDIHNESPSAYMDSNDSMELVLAQAAGHC